MYYLGICFDLLFSFGSIYFHLTFLEPLPKSSDIAVSSSFKDGVNEFGEPQKEMMRNNIYKVLILTGTQKFKICL